MADITELGGPFAFLATVPPVATFVSVAQRTDGSFLVDAIYALSKDGGNHRYGAFKYGAQKYGPDDFIFNANLIAADYSIDGGNNWFTAAPQAVDRRHNMETPMPIDATPANFDFVWNAFWDLPDDFDGEAMLRFEFSGSSTVVVTTPPFQVSTDEDTSTTFEKVEARRRVPRIDDYLGEGPIAPLRRGGSDFMTARGKELVRSSVQQILGTRSATDRWGGEVEWEPGFGSLFWTLKHAPGDEITIEQAKGFAELALAWEPRVQFIDAITRYEDREGGRAMFILVKFRFIESNVPENQVVMPKPLEVEIEVT